MPVVGRSAGQGVQIEDELLAVHDGQRGMALGKGSQSAGELDLLPGAEFLPADEHDAMRQEGGPHLGDLGVRGVAQVEPRELGADAPVRRRTPDRGRRRVRIDCHGLTSGTNGHIPHGTGLLSESRVASAGRRSAPPGAAGNTCEQRERDFRPERSEGRKGLSPHVSPPGLRQDFCHDARPEVPFR